jgi:CheY-like chemotaxis protein
MSLSTTAAAVCFIACHGGPADYFATFSQQLEKEKYHVDIYASGAACKKFEERNVSITERFNADAFSSTELENLAKKIAGCYHRVIIDVAHPKNIELIEKLKQQNSKIRITAFYDNPDVYVPGGYSYIAAKVLLVADKVLFVNAHHAKEKLFRELGEEIPLPVENRVGIGCYPLKKAEELANQRKCDQVSMRAQLFSTYKLEDKGQKVLVYFGGNNTEYFDAAFPSFLRFLSEGIAQTDLSNIVIVLQQHPGAKSKNLDRQQIEAWKAEHSANPYAPEIVISNQNSGDMQVLADGILYHQTSMGPLFALAGIGMIQVGEKTPYKDGMVDSKICPSVTKSSDLVQAMQTVESKPLLEEEKDSICNSLGIKKDWLTELKRALI